MILLLLPVIGVGSLFALALGLDWWGNRRPKSDPREVRIAELENEVETLRRKILASTLRDGRNRGLYHRN